MGYLLVFFNFLSFLSFAQTKIPKLDPNKFTVCAITINSDNERAVFEEQVKKYPNEFNPIVELTDIGENDWFDKACQSKIRCDQLVISGHFGGSFFGSSGKYLPLSLLEDKGCSKSCEGVLDQPYEVFLFGCNTLSTKEKDHRTPQEYLQVLLNDGIPRVQAELVVESRYGAIGDDHKSKMQRAFGGNYKQLYGFDSVGPSGKNVESFLKKYFTNINSIDHLKKLQAKRMMDLVELTNTTQVEATAGPGSNQCVTANRKETPKVSTDPNNKILADILKNTAFTQCSAGSDDGDKNKETICSLLDDTKSLDFKLGVLGEALSDEKFLIYLPSINRFLNKHPINSMTSAQKAQIAEFASNVVIKNQILTLLNSTKKLSLLTEWIKFAANFGYIDTQLKSKLISDLVNNQFSNNLSIMDKDVICSLDQETINGIVLDIKKFENTTFSTLDYLGLACLKPHDEKVQLKFLTGMYNENFRLRNIIANTFAKLTPLSKEVQLKLAEGIKDKDWDVAGTYLNSFRDIRPQDKEVQLKILQNGIENGDSYVLRVMLNAFSSIQPEDKEVQLKLLKLLNNENKDTREAAANLYKDLQIKDQDVIMELLKGMGDKSSSIRSNIARAFIKIAPQDRETQNILMKGLDDPSSEVRIQVAKVFKAINPQDNEIQVMLISHLSDSDWQVKQSIAETFKIISPKDHGIQLKLLDEIKNNDWNVAESLVEMFKVQRKNDPEIPMKLTIGLKNNNPYSRLKIINVFKDLVPLNKEVQLKLLEELNGIDHEIRENVMKIFNENPPMIRKFNYNSLVSLKIKMNLSELAYLFFLTI